MKRIISFVTCIILVASLTTLTYAQGESVGSDQTNIRYESVNPSQGYQYLMKRLKEKMNLMFNFSTEGKIIYYKELLRVRLAELKYVVDNKSITDIETTSQRYSATAGEITNLVISYDVNNHKQEIKDLLVNHLTIIDILKGKYDDTTAEWRFVEDDSNYLKIYISKLD